MNIPDHRSPEAAYSPLSPAAERGPSPLDAVLKRLARLLVTFDARRRTRRAAAECAAPDEHAPAGIGSRRPDLPRALPTPRPVDPWRRVAGGRPR